MANAEVGARQVGEFPNMDRKVIRSRRNPIDKCTIISILPKLIEEPKPSIEPGFFRILPGSYDKPSILVIGGSSWWKDVNEDQPLLEIPVSSVQVADAVINDCIKSMLGYKAGISEPGLFFVLGEESSIAISMKYKAELVKRKTLQDSWFHSLVLMADALWARSNGNPLSIHNDMRLAAQELNLNDKPWIRDYKTMEMIKCFACGTLKSPDYPVCPACKAIDMSNPSAKDIKFAI